MKHELESLVVPDASFALFRRRTEAFVRIAANAARLGELRLDQLAINCYAQGVWDGVCAHENHTATEPIAILEGL